MDKSTYIAWSDNNNSADTVKRGHELPVVQTASLDITTEAIKNIGYEHSEIHKGDHYYICGFGIVAASATTDFTVITPSGDKLAHMTFDVEGTSQTEFYIYEGVTATGGASALPMNNNRNSSNTSSLTIFMNQAVSATGTLIFSQSKGLVGATPAKANAEGLIHREREIILRAGTRYLFRIRSLDTGNIISYCGEWYEHTNKTKYT